MTDDTCPACGEPIEDIEQVGRISYELQPCGHQIDDRLYEKLSTRANENPVPQ